MNTVKKEIILISIGIIILCFLSVLLFTRPSLIPLFNLSKKDNIASAINGLTAPVIGIVSSILLYLALIKQNDAMNEQRSKNESDIFLMLFNHLTEQVNQFYFQKRVNGVKETTRGLEGLKEFISNYCYVYNFNDPVFKDSTFGNNPHGVQYLLLIDIYLAIKDKLLNSTLSSKEKHFYETMLYHYYSAYFRKANIKLMETFEKFPSQKDSRTVEIKIAYDLWNNYGIQSPFKENADGFFD